MKKYPIFLSMLFASMNIFSQATFQKKYGQNIYQEGAGNIITTFDGNYMIGGHAYRPSIGADDLYLLKINPFGVIQYGKLWARSGYFDIISSIKQTGDSGFIMLTSARVVASGATNSLLVKANSQGILQWNKSFGNSSGTIYNANLEITSDSGYIMLTNAYVSPLPYQVVHLQKLNSSGDTTWSKIYKTYGGTNARTVKQTSDDGYIIGGTAYNGAIADPFLLKADMNGNIQWFKTYSMNTNDVFDWLEKTSDGGFIFTCTSRPNHADSARVIVVKTNDLGDTTWSRMYENANSITANRIKETSDHGFLITGFWRDTVFSNTDVYVLKLDNTGSVSWSKRYGTAEPDAGSDIMELANTGFLVLGSYGIHGTSDPDIYLIQTDLSGDSGCNENNLTTFMNNQPVQLDTILYTQDNFPYSLSTVTFSQLSATDQTTLCSTVDIAEINSGSFFSIFPNPAADVVTLSMPDKPDHVQVRIIDILGHEVYKHVLVDGEKITTSEISDGIYLLRASINGRETCKKLIIKR